MRSGVFTAALSFLLLSHAPLGAHELLAKAEARALTEADQRAAARAEEEALDRDETIRDFEWKGPDGGTGLLIVSGEFPSLYGMGRCRRLVHIIRHPGDRGVNPTFDGVVCRDWEGRWSVREP